MSGICTLIMFPQRSIAAAKAAFIRGKGLQLAPYDLRVSCLNPAQRASSSLSNLRTLFCLAAGRKIFPLFPGCWSYLSSPWEYLCTNACTGARGWARRHGAFAGTMEPGKQQLFLAQGFILGLRLTASFVQSTWGFDSSQCRFSGSCHVRDLILS